MKFLIVIVGPTAVGKTSFSIEMAQFFGTEVVSVDSRQVFKELEIGTAKPTQEEQAQAIHHFVDSHSIHEDFNAGDFEREALLLLEELYKKHDVVVLTGGSGLYVKALTDGMAEMPQVPAEVRDELKKEAAENGLEKLLNELNDKDPEYFAEVDVNNPQRVIRALEVIRGTGQKYSELRKDSKKERPFNTIKIGLERPREELYARIDLRMDQMIEEGLFDEAESFHKFKHINALQTVGYKEIFDYLDGEYDYEEAVRLLKRNSRRYAKRQMTWFRKDDETVWFHPKDKEEALSYIKQRMEKGR
ncbi:tRNA (adenosine(37)-N6)-dimethylallyltransferase MiaA [Fulvivirga maritima]|uniref:tRNA (adenosine(37)-N6)-dimethylallyltransferase MiaA n=1 Tax=Fulvivirga maritima TaxID=2904247 RepID=UPI001F021A7E|nr:tRNA (adenosine(37)-N6)-dimethylallyltransferase MiaA [Fulvivirga maritima]UII29447.1 tRNA (adenosine(37)-N6)-dimethylallyltransferase MiaA [Fulvivirga maritima]